MATRQSKTFKPKEKEIIDVKNTVVSSANLADYITSMKEEDINYDFIMTIYGDFEGKTICNPYDLLIVPPHRFHYIDENGKERANQNEFTTTVGIYIMNLIMSEVGISKLFDGYLNETFNKKTYKKVEKKLSYALIEDDITTDQLARWEDYNQWFMPFEDVISPNHTEKMLVITKLVKKKKEELLKANKEAIEKGDVVVIEKIEKELITYAQDILKDDPSIDTLDSGAGADWGNNFKNMYLIKGAVMNPDPNAKQRYTIVTSNYADGVTAKEYPTVAGSGAHGAYSRGKKTEQGGYMGKQFIRAYQHLHLDPKGSDCGTKRTIEVELTESNYDKYIYSYVVNGSSTELLTSKNQSKYIGKKVKLRFSALCESKTGICNKCAGELLYDACPDGNVGLVVSQIAEKLKLIAMKSFHDSVVHTSKVDPERAFFPY